MSTSFLSAIRRKHSKLNWRRSVSGSFKMISDLAFDCECLLCWTSPRPWHTWHHKAPVLGIANFQPSFITTFGHPTSSLSVWLKMQLFMRNWEIMASHASQLESSKWVCRAGNTWHPKCWTQDRLDSMFVLMYVQFSSKDRFSVLALCSGKH